MEDTNSNFSTSVTVDADERQGILKPAVSKHFSKLLVDLIEKGQTGITKPSKSTNQNNRQFALLRRDGPYKQKQETVGVHDEVTQVCSQSIANLLTASLREPEGNNAKIQEALFELVKPQRDMYIIGTSIIYPFPHFRNGRFARFTPQDFPLIESLARKHCLGLLSNFIPSSACFTALKPLLISQMQENGPIQEQITKATCNSIPLAQPLLNRIIKNAVIEFLDDAKLRTLAKNRIISTTLQVGMKPLEEMSLPKQDVMIPSTIKEQSEIILPSDDAKATEKVVNKVEIKSSHDLSTKKTDKRSIDQSDLDFEPPEW